jgi:hypothetical protein
LSKATSAALLGVAIALGLGGWWLFGSDGSRPPRPPGPGDDLDLVAALLDAAPMETAHDLLVAGAGELTLARAADRTVVAVTVGPDAGTPRTLARLEGPAQGMCRSSGAVYVTSKHAIESIPLAGGDARVVAELGRPGDLACDGRWLFVLDVDPALTGLTHATSVVRISLDGGDRVVLGRSDGEIANLAVDADDVFWADRLEGTIVAAPKTGSRPRVLARDRGLPGTLAVDARDVTWVEKRSESLWSMPKGGGEPRRLVQDFAGFARVVASEGGVFWTNEGAVEGGFGVFTVRADGEATGVSPLVDAIDALATDGANVYWARGAEVRRVR